MTEPLSFTPAGRRHDKDAGAPVRRRRVLFVPGYDPEAEGRYRMLFVRETIRYAKRFGLRQRDISRIQSLPDLPGQRWTASASGDGWSVETDFEVLRWDDLVLRDFGRQLPIAIALLLTGVVASAVTGTMARFWRLNWKFGGVILYPCVMVLAFLGASIGCGMLVDHVFSTFVPAPAWSRRALTFGAAGLTFCGLYPLGARWFVWHLMHDWVFNFQQGMGWRPDYQARVDRFADHVVGAISVGGVDEILVVGHSSGSTMAVDIVATALARWSDPADPALRLSLLTIGSCVPIVALNPVARRYRANLQALMIDQRLFWAEYQAPQDWINFAGFNPVRDLDHGLSAASCVNPTIRSARFREIVADKTYRAILYRPFRMHFQFLMANDVAGEYDYVMMTVGPFSLQDRVTHGPAPNPPTSSTIAEVPERMSAAT